MSAQLKQQAARIEALELHFGQSLLEAPGDVVVLGRLVDGIKLTAGDGLLGVSDQPIDGYHANASRRNPSVASTHFVT